MPPRILAAVFAGGCAGTLARAALVEAASPDGDAWPWPTFAANVAGAFLLGLLAARLPPASPRLPLLASGFCGALTTFSTVQLEVLVLLDEARTGLAAAYVAASVAAGLVAVRLASRVSAA